MVRVLFIVFSILACSYAGEKKPAKGDNQKMRADTVITAQQALNHNCQAWKSQIKSQVKSHPSAAGIETRLDGTENEIKMNSFKAHQMTVSNAMTLLELPGGKAPPFLYVSAADFPKDGKV